METRQLSNNESALLGAILMHGNECLSPCVMAELVPSDFQNLMLGRVYGAMLDLHDAAEPVNLLTVCGQMRSAGLIKTAVDEINVHRIMDGYFIRSHSPWYVEQILEASRKRGIVRIIEDVAASAAADGVNSDDVRLEAMTRLNAMEVSPDKSETLADVVAEIEAPRDENAIIETSIIALDTMLGPIEPQGLYVIAGEPGCGKTTFLMNLLEHNVKRGHPVALCSLEQTRRMIVSSMLVRASGLSLQIIRAGGDGSDQYKQARARVRAMPFHVEDKPQTPDSFRSWAERMVKKHKVEIIALDYLQAMIPGRSYSGMNDRVEHYSMTVRDVAKMLNVPVILVSSLSRQGELRGSAQIDFDAFAVMMLTVDSRSDTEGRLQLEIKKNRYGQSNITMPMRIDYEKMRTSWGGDR